jgi:hypothetical protein
MKRKRFTEEQIIGVLREHELGAKTADLCRKHGWQPPDSQRNWIRVGGNVTGGVAALTTHEGSAHGHANKNYRIEARHARLAVHAAHTMAVFLLETWEARKKANG